MNGAAATELNNPFPGLRPFREEEAHLFFGRENQVDSMVDKLARMRFLAVVGTSGSGKSSLVNCGLRPALHRGLMAMAGTSWRVAQFRPGSNPLRAMAGALAKEGVLFSGFESGAVSLQDIVEASLRMSNLGLLDVYEQARPGENVNLLVVVDQFEELFRYRALGTSASPCLQDLSQQAVAFVNLLLKPKAQLNYPVYVVLTMRSDFLGRCAEFTGLPEAINEGQYLVPRLTREERRAAIAGPISVGGGEITPVLLTRLVNDVGDNPDQLSILQHALNRTWARWQHQGCGEGPLDLPHYDAIGTMARALDQHAEKAYAELQGDRQSTICEKIFQALTDKWSNPEGIRRPASLATLCALAGANPAEVIEVIDVFRKPSRSFLMPPLPEILGRDTVIDISHESLMRVWERLKLWSDEEALSAQLYRRLSETTVLHAAGKAGLWRDPDLQIALEWREREKPTEAWAVLYGGAFEPAMTFLAESEAQREKEVREREERQARELQQAQALAEERHRRAEEQTEAARRLRWAARGLAIFALLLIGAVIFVWKQRAAAIEERRQAFAVKLAAQAVNNSEDSVDLALLLSLEANHISDAPAVHGSLLAGLAASPHLTTFLQGRNTPTVRCVAFSPDGKTLASASEDGTIILWDVHTGWRLSAPLTGHIKAVSSVAFSPDGKLLASGGVDGTIRLWNVETGQPTAPPLSASDEVNGVAFNQDGSVLASANNDGSINLWDVSNRSDVSSVFSHHRNLGGHKGAAYTVAFSPDGKTLSSGGADKAIRLWDVAGGNPLSGPPLTGHEGEVFSVTFSPNGETLASGGRDRTIILWKVKTREQLYQPLRGHLADVTCVAFSPDSKTLASASVDKSIVLWDVATGNQLGDKLTGHAVATYSVAFAPAASETRLWKLASGGGDGTVILWDNPPNKWLGLPLEHHQFVRTVAFSRDGKMLASGGKGLVLWDVINSKVVGPPLLGRSEVIDRVAFSPDGRILASVSDGTINLWDVRERRQLPAPLLRQKGEVSSLTFKPDPNAKILAWGKQDGTIVLWDVDRDSPFGAPFSGHKQKVLSLVFSNDGRKLASGSKDGSVMLWDATDVTKIKPLGSPLTGHTRGVYSLAFSPDGKTLASGSDDTSIILWDVEKHRLNGVPLAKHRAGVTALAFSPDGRMLASSSYDKSIILWDLDTHQAIGPALREQNAAVFSLAFSPDGKTLASGSDMAKNQDNWPLVLWDVDFDSWQSRACQITERSLSELEWKTYLGQEPYRATCPITMLEDADRLALEKRTEEASVAFSRVVQTAIKTNDGNLNNFICGYGVSNGFAKIVLPACERAIGLLPHDGEVYDGRGVARALTGPDHYSDAIKDFEFFLEWSQGREAMQERRREREAWIIELKAGRNPFDSATLKALRRE
jgi:WD40 repeat protein